MGAAANLNSAESTGAQNNFPKAKEACFAAEANELYFGVVGHVGSGTGFVAARLLELIQARDYTADLIKASHAIRDWAEKSGRKDVPAAGGRSEICKTVRLQELGDEMRQSSEDYAAVAQGIISRIRKKRGEWTGQKVVNGEAVQPDKAPRAYIIESIRHPAEVALLRVLYGEAFALVGVVCHENVREKRLLEKYFEWSDRSKPESKQTVSDLMARDADDKSNKFGQHVADAFWEADYFIDNTANSEGDREYSMNESLGRLIDIITHAQIVRPTMYETGMHIAVSAQIRSACLSRQVGAAIVDDEGNVIAIGSNEVPKAGGGVYGESFYPEDDLRCDRCDTPHCSSNAEQNVLIEKLTKEFPDLSKYDDIVKKMRKAGLGSLLEFTRAIHAEMDAITSAARRGISVRGATMFVTTFPCHYCARHIVAAGLDQVQYIEPYPKSRALALHGDSITNRTTGWVAPRRHEGDDKEVSEGEFRMVGHESFGKDRVAGKVLFRPFTGVAPRLYQRAFSKDRPLKNDVTGNRDIGQPAWGGKWGIRMVPYTDLEARLTEGEGDEQ